MDTGERRPQFSEAELGTDVRAALRARQELGPDMEDHVMDAFLTRLQSSIDERVDQQVAGHVQDQHRLHAVE